MVCAFVVFMNILLAIGPELHEVCLSVGDGEDVKNHRGYPFFVVQHFLGEGKRVYIFFLKI